MKAKNYMESVENKILASIKKCASGTVFLDIWHQDYNQMCESMIYGDKPDWDELMTAMMTLQERVRAAAR